MIKVITAGLAASTEASAVVSASVDLEHHAQQRKATRSAVSIYQQVIYAGYLMQKH